MKKVVYLLMLAAGAGILSASAADGLFSVRTASYNIRCYGAWEEDTANKWVYRSADVVNLVKDIDPDVIGFQEVDPEQMTELKQKLSDYEIIGKHRETDNTKRATPVAYRKSRFDRWAAGRSGFRPRLTCRGRATSATGTRAAAPRPAPGRS